MLRTAFLFILTAVALLPTAAASQADAARLETDTLIVPSGSLRLTAIVWRAESPMPSPVVLFAHGSGCDAPTLVEKVETLAPAFVSRGFTFVSLFRRGHGLSRGEGECAGDLMRRERTQRGDDARASLQFRLMIGDHFDDLLAAIAFLKGQPHVDRERVIVLGHSFGGQLAILAAEQEGMVRAAIGFGAAANSWSGSAQLRERLLRAAGKAAAPLFIAHAANDLSVEPGEALAAEMTRLGRPHRLRIYPPTGVSPADGHNFIFLGRDQWVDDVFEFLADHGRK